MIALPIVIENKTVFDIICRIADSLTYGSRLLHCGHFSRSREGKNHEHTDGALAGNAAQSGLSSV